MIVEPTMTDWMRNRPRLTAVLAGIVSVAVLVLVSVLVSGGDKPSTKEPSAFGTPLPETTETPSGLPTTDATPSAKPSTAAEVKAAAEQAFKQFGSGMSGSGLKPGSLSMAGLQGGSVYKYLPRHRIQLRVSSSAPIGTIGYVVPTSLDKQRGVLKNVGTSWSLSTIAYGDPDYAQLFMQAGARGFPITCTITVDGRVTEQRSTEGPYGQLICQG